MRSSCAEPPEVCQDNSSQSGTSYILPPQAHLASLPPTEADKPTDQSDEVIHESNEWGEWVSWVLVYITIVCFPSPPLPSPPLRDLAGG